MMCVEGRVQWIRSILNSFIQVTELQCQYYCSNICFYRYILRLPRPERKRKSKNEGEKKKWRLKAMMCWARKWMLMLVREQKACFKWFLIYEYIYGLFIIPVLLVSRWHAWFLLPIICARKPLLIWLLILKCSKKVHISTNYSSFLLSGHRSSKCVLIFEAEWLIHFLHIVVLFECIELMPEGERNLSIDYCINAPLCVCVCEWMCELLI